MTTQSINLNVIPGGVLPRINVSQYDKGLEQIVATLYEGSSAFEMPSSATVYVQGTKKDGTGFQYTCSYSNNVITIDLTEQMTVFAGEVVTELVIFDSSNNRIATCNFIINVEQTALSDDTQISETDLPIIQTIPQSVSACEGYAETAHQWATYGSDSETPSSTNNSKYWAEQSQVYAQGALHWKGSIAFASIPTSNLTVGDLYNITNDFTTDSRFVEGSGKECAAGTNIVWSDSSKWDILTSATYASQVKYDNTDSGLSATNVQSAIDEIDAEAFRSRGQCTETDANTIIKPGVYWCNSSITSNLPTSGWQILEVITTSTTNQNYPLIQKARLAPSTRGYYERHYYHDNSTNTYKWTDWRVTVAFTGNASDVTYDNTTSGLESTDTQGAIDELNSDLSVLSNNLLTGGYFLTNNRTINISENLFPGFCEGGHIFIYIPFMGDVNEITNITESHTIFFAYHNNGRYESGTFVDYKIIGSTVRLHFTVPNGVQTYGVVGLRYAGTITVS